MVSLAYDIFERLPDGQPLWVKAVASLEEAREEIAALGVRRGRSALDFLSTTCGEVRKYPPASREALRQPWRCNRRLGYCGSFTNATYINRSSR